MSEANLVLHCGGREVTPEALKAIPCPQPEGRWHPVPHHQVLEHAQSALSEAGYQIESMKLGLARDDQRFFGVMNLASTLVTGVNLAVGIRSSLDRSIALGWATGSRVFVCDNMAFRSDRILSRKHTTFGVERYREAICKAVRDLPEFHDAEAERIRRMQLRIIDNHFAESFLLRAYQDEQLLSPRTLPTALKEWRQPSFPNLEEPTAWRLFNAVTYALKPRFTSNAQAAAEATIRLNHLLTEDAPAVVVPVGDIRPGNSMVARPPAGT